MNIAYVTADSGAPVYGTKGASTHICEPTNSFRGLGYSVQILAAKLEHGNDKLGAQVLKVRGGAAVDEYTPDEGGEHANRLVKAICLGPACSCRPSLSTDGFPRCPA